MRVLFITSSAAAGGGPRHLLDWVEAMKTHIGDRFEPFVAAPSEGLFAEPLQRLAIESFALPEKKFSWTCLKNLERFIRKNRIELVHSFGRGGGLYGRLLARKGLPVFHSPQGLISSGFSQVVYDWLERGLKRRTTQFVFGSSSEAEEGRRRFGAWEGLILPPVIFSPNKVRDPHEVRDLGSKQPIIIGSVGRFVAHKRMLDLARAVIEMGPDFQLRLFGGGEQETELEAIAKASGGQIQVCGLVDRWEALSQIDVFASWSLSESFGLAVAEAMTFGIPCVLSDVSGHRDLAAGGERAWLFDPSSPADFAQAVRSVLQDEEARVARVSRAANEIGRLCANERIAHAIWDAYCFVLE